MKASHRAYERAQTQLRVAELHVRDVNGDEAANEEAVEQAALALGEAEVAMRDAEDAVRAEFDAAWERNRQGVQDAKAAVEDAMRRRLVAETTVAAACKKAGRNPSPQEADQCNELRDEWLAAKAALVAAQETFKSGVTPEQLAAG